MSTVEYSPRLKDRYAELRPQLKEELGLDQASLEVIQTLASQAAVALGNIQRYQEQRQRTELLRRRAETLTKLTEVSHVLNFEQPLEQTLRTIANSIRETTSFQAVLISVYERDWETLVRVVEAERGIRAATGWRLEDVATPEAFEGDAEGREAEAGRIVRCGAGELQVAARSARRQRAEEVRHPGTGESGHDQAECRAELVAE